MNEFHHQPDNRLQSICQLHIPNHVAADPLKQPKLFFRTFKLLLELPESARHDLIMAHDLSRRKKTLIRL